MWERDEDVTAAVVHKVVIPGHDDDDYDKGDDDDDDDDDDDYDDMYGDIPVVLVRNVDVELVWLFPPAGLGKRRY